MTKRREFITLIGGAVTWPLTARAQQAQLPTIGFLGGEASTWSEWTAAFVRRLRELGWIEGRTVAIEFRWSTLMCQMTTASLSMVTITARLTSKCLVSNRAICSVSA